MRTIWNLMQKEFLQIFRNRGMLPIIFIMPFIQLVILSNAATFDIRLVPMHLQDRDRSVLSERLFERFTAGGYFRLTGSSADDGTSIDALLDRSADLTLVIPRDFERDLLNRQGASVQLMINAEDGFSAGLIQAYASEIIAGFNRELQSWVTFTTTPVPEIALVSAAWYNPRLDYLDYMMPGILVVLVTLIGLFLSGMNVVREREIGTIDQINVTPIKRYQFIAGKLLPFWIIALAEMSVGLLLAVAVFHVPMLGSYALIYLVAGIYMLVVLGMGLFISTITETQQQAMFIAWFFMVVFILMSGLFTAIESMPHWAQTMTMVNPVRHFVDIMRRIMLKGSGIAEIRVQLAWLAGYAVLMLVLAVNRYRKVAR